MERIEIARAIGEKIRKERKKQNLSQEKLAMESNIHPSYFGCIERGEKCPTVDTLYKISLALNVPVNKLLDIDQPQTEESLPSGVWEKAETAIKKLPAEKQESFAEIIKNLADIIEPS